MIDGVARPVPQSAGVSQTSRRVIALTIAVLVAVAIRAVLLPAAGLQGDLDVFAQWVGHISNNGLTHAYDEELTFGPVMTYVWWLLGLVEPGFRTATDSSDPGLRILLKLPAVLADFGLAACVYWILRATPGWAVVGAVVVLLHPATWYVSAWWGQYESVYVLAALLAVLLAISGRDGLAAAALALAILTKPQAVPFLVPFAAWFLARGGPTGLLRAALIGAGVAFVLWLPFLGSGGLLHYLGNLGNYQDDVYSVLSLRAWNFWWIVQDMAPVDEFVSDRVPILGPVTFRTLAFAVTGLLALYVAVRVWRVPEPRTLVLGVATMSLVAFTFLTTMHERYAYGAFLFLLLLIPEARMRWLAAVLGVVFAFNLVAAAPATSELGRLLPIWGPLGLIGSVVMVALAIILLLELRREPGPGAEPQTGPSAP
jgi:Gpi18-like mannosyltransferase